MLFSQAEFRMAEMGLCLKLVPTSKIDAGWQEIINRRFHSAEMWIVIMHSNYGRIKVSHCLA